MSTGSQLSIQAAPSYVYFAPETFKDGPPSHFTMDPTRVVNIYHPPAPQVKPVPQVVPTPQVKQAVMSNDTGALGEFGGHLGSAAGRAFGPLVYQYIYPGQEYAEQAKQFGETLAPVGRVVGKGLGDLGYWGYKLIS